MALLSRRRREEKGSRGRLKGRAATLLAGLGRTDEAGELHGRALAVFESALGAEHPHTEICRKGIGALRAP